MNAGCLAACKRLIFEAHALIVADLKQRVEKGEGQVVISLTAAERESRIDAQKLRLQGLTFTADEDCAFKGYNLVHAMLQKSTLVYLHPEKFVTRRQQAFKRRALAFDMVGACSYNCVNMYHSRLMQRAQELPPPGHVKVTLAQVLRAGRAAFTCLADTVRSLRRQADGSLPLWTPRWTLSWPTSQLRITCFPYLFLPSLRQLLVRILARSVSGRRPRTLKTSGAAVQDLEVCPGVLRQTVLRP